MPFIACNGCAGRYDAYILLFMLWTVTVTVVTVVFFDVVRCGAGLCFCCMAARLIVACCHGCRQPQFEPEYRLNLEVREMLAVKMPVPWRNKK